MNGMTRGSLIRAVVVAGLLTAGASRPLAIVLDSSATAAPVPARPGPQNLIWVRYHKTGRLVALDLSGRTQREIELADGPMLLRLSPAQSMVWFAGQKGRIPTPLQDEPEAWPEGNFTLHVRGINAEKDGTDLRIPLTWESFISPDGTTVGLVVRKYGPGLPKKVKNSTVENSLIDVATRKETKLDLQGNHRLCGIAPDRTWVLTYQNIPNPEKGAPPWRIYKVPVAGGQPQLLSGALSPSWGHISPDGTRVLTFAKDPRFDPTVNGDESINTLGYVIDVATTKATSIFRHDSQFYPAGMWSPDGKRIAYTWSEWGAKPYAEGGVARTRLVTCDADGRNAATVLKDDEIFYPVAWW